MREEFAGRELPVPPVTMRMNLVVTDVPFDEGSIAAHLDTTTGEIVLDTGHLDAADLTVTVEYSVAKAILVDAEPSGGHAGLHGGPHQGGRRHVEAARLADRADRPGPRRDRRQDEGDNRVAPQSVCRARSPAIVGICSASSAIVQRSAFSISWVSVQGWKYCTLPPWTKKVLPVIGQDSVAR